MIPEYERKEAEMLERALSWLERLGGIEAVLGERIKLSRHDRNLPPEELARRLILGLYQYITSNPNGDLTTNRLSRFFDIGDNRRLTTLIRIAFPDHIPPPSRRIPGSVINILRREAGMDNSYIEEVTHKYPGLKIGCRDITSEIRIPPRIDGEVARSAGWISTARYSRDYERIEAGEGVERVYTRRQAYVLTFRGKDLPFLELEFIPFFEEYFNYSPYVGTRICEGFGRKLRDITSVISQRAIMSFYRDVLGVKEEREERTILFKGELKRYFIAGLIDMWGYISSCSGGPYIKLYIPPEFRKMAGELAEELDRGLTTYSNYFVIHLGWGRRLVEAIEKYPISNPYLLYPILWWKETGELRKWPL